MSAKMRKSLNFDLNTKKLKEYYPNKNYTEAYNDIKKFLTNNGFSHRQGSGYISKKEMSTAKVTKIIEKLNINCSWLYTCCKTLDYYDVGKEHSGLEILENLNKDMERSGISLYANKTLEVNKTREKEIKQTYKISNYEPKKVKTKDKDIER